MLLALARIASATAFQSGSWASVTFSSVFRKASRPSTCPAMAAIIGPPPMPSWPIIIRIMPIIDMPPIPGIEPADAPPMGAAVAAGDVPGG
jgi:hypothetical protein